MKTDDLVNLLSSGVAPVKACAVCRELTFSVPIACVGAALLMVAIFGIRPDFASVSQTGLFWEKIAFPLCVSIGALIGTARLARPTGHVGFGWHLMVAPVIAVWIAGAIVVSSAPSYDRISVLLGHTWRSGPFNILLLSIPGFAIIFRAVSRLAPTNLRLAGGVSGLLASSIGTVAYCFHCPEMSPAFWGIWYLLGMLIPTVAGALLGPRMLRW